MTSPIEGLKAYISDYLLADVRPIDIWEVEIVCRPAVGCIKTVEDVEGGRRAKKEIMGVDASTGQEVIARSFSRKMANYCSIGIDARIGLGFDKSRSSSRLMNKIVYAWEGMKKFARQNMNMQNIIEKMEILDSFQKIDLLALEETLHDRPCAPSSPKATDRIQGYHDLQPNAFSDHLQLNHPHGDLHNHPELPFLAHCGLGSFSSRFYQSPAQQSISTSPLMVSLAKPDLISSNTNNLPHRSSETMNENTMTELEGRTINGYRVTTREIFRTGSEEERTLTIAPVNIIALNIPSYMGGVTGMWDKSTPTSSIKSQEGLGKANNKQDMGDGELEFLSFTGNLQLGVFERLLTGGGKRVAQGRNFLIRGRSLFDHVQAKRRSREKAFNYLCSD